MATARRASVYFDETVHKALRLKAAETEQSISDLANTAVRNTLAEDADDLAAFRDRANEPTLAFEDLLRDMSDVASYSVRIKRSAAKEPETVPSNDRKRIIKRIEGRAREPRPPGCEKLSSEEKYRLRQGDDRIRYAIVDQERIVTVVTVGNRRGGYLHRLAAPNAVMRRYWRSRSSRSRLARSSGLIASAQSHAGPKNGRGI